MGIYWSSNDVHLAKCCIDLPHTGRQYFHLQTDHGAAIKWRNEAFYFVNLCFRHSDLYLRRVRVAEDHKFYADYTKTYYSASDFSEAQTQANAIQSLKSFYGTDKQRYECCISVDLIPWCEDQDLFAKEFYL